ncbi:hypothetical protein ACGFZJ_15440 [Streptomyces sp. NPDC048253]|uniref:hypothetical protein n=1 Tax=Streptomyces sp. NPDC048253 TaxID=3365524 RepID=UPI0037227FCD
MAPVTLPGRQWRRYGYVGPQDVRRAVVPGAGGRVIRCAADLDAYAMAEEGEPFTYVVGLDGLLRLAPRRSEHVACAGGADVLGAGEISFRRTPLGPRVHEVSNQSTGYCPDPDSWPAVAAALDGAGIGRPDGFTHALVFRRCERCGENSVVREGVFVCVFCDSDLPLVWNVHVTPRDP